MMFLIEEHYFRENHQEVSNLKDWNSSLYQFTRNTSPTVSKNHIKSGHFHAPNAQFSWNFPSTNCWSSSWGDPAKYLQYLPTSWWNAGCPRYDFFSFTTQLHDMFIHNMFIQPKTQHSSLCRRKKIPRCFPMSQASRSAVAKLARLAVRRAPSPALIAATSWPNGNFSSKPLDPSEASRRRSSREGVLGDGGMADDGCVLKEPTFLGDSLKNNGI